MKCTFQHQTTFKNVRANCFCASVLRTAARANSHATSCIERARQVLKCTTIGQMAIALALLGFYALGRSVTPTFIFKNRFYLHLSPHCPKMNKKSMWEGKKKSRFLSARRRILPRPLLIMLVKVAYYASSIAFFWRNYA